MTVVSEKQVESLVRDQYEQLPYPPRDPADEANGLKTSYTDFLPLITQSCFRGMRDLRDGGRILVAGSGTGDVEIFMAEQLYGSSGEIIALDLSDASIAVARARAEARGLEDRIRWIRGSILDIDSMNLGKFDYITSSGVLHHLSDPGAGLQALRGALKTDGAMGLMVYGQHGRTAIYQMQDTLRTISSGCDVIGERIELARRVLRGLPETNWFARSQDLVNDHIALGDAGIVDLLLHPCDRAFTVPELMDWIQGADLSFIDFSYDRTKYDPGTWISDEGLRAVLQAKTPTERYAIGELMAGSLYCHYLYCAPTADRQALVGDPGMVPSIWMDRGHVDLAAAIRTGGEITVVAPKGARRILPTECSWLADVYDELDGLTSAEKIAERVSARVGVHSDDVMRELKRQCVFLQRDDMMLLRHESIPPFRSPAELELRLRGLSFS